MTIDRLSGFHLTERMWQAVIFALSVAVIIVTIWCLSHGITIIFMHLYYFPIVLLAYHYRWKGFGLSTLLAFAYLGLVLVFDAGQPDLILGALYRFLVFVGIAAVIAYLSEQLAKTQSTLQQSAELRERYISLAPAIVLALDRDGRITLLNEKGCLILECSFEEVRGKPWIETFIKESERELIHSVFNNIIGGNAAPYHMVEGKVISFKGTERFIRWYNTPLKDADGTITGTLSYGEDITEERRAQDTLKKMQQFQESVIANANVWISVLSPNGTLLVWNEAAEAISGYKKSEVLGKNTVWKQLYPDKDYRGKVTVEIQRIIGRNQFLENFETEIRCADGTAKTIVWNTRGLRGSEGAITGFIAIGRDVSAQRAAEFRAAESSRFLGIMIDTLPMPVFFKDTSGKYLGCNPPFEEYIGIKRDSLIGKTVYDISPKDLADIYNASDRRVFDHPVPQRYETQVQYADGSRHDVIFYKAPFFNKDGSVGGLIGAFLDITERKQAEMALQESEEKYRAFFTTSQDCVFITTVDGRWVDFNDASVGLFGYESREKLLKTDIPSLYANPHERDAHIRYIREKGYSFEYPVDLRKKDGTIINTLITSVARKDPSGNVIGFQGSIRDITERKATQDRIQALLRVQEEQVRIINTSPAVAFLWRATENWPVEMVSENISQFGYTRDDFISGRVLYSAIIHPEDLDHVSREVEYYGSHNIDDFSQEYRIFGKDKKEYWVADYTHIRRDALEKITHYEGVILDITRRKQTEEEIRRSNIILKTQQETSPDGILIVDETGKIISSNQRFAEMWGIPEDVIASRSDEGALQSIVDSLADPETFLTRVAYLYSHKEEKSREEILLKDGGVFDRYSAPMIEQDGKYYGRVWYFRDVTDYKRVEDEIRQLNATLEQRVRDRIAELEMATDQIRASLEEKVVLLREVHHRVKNNLQIIISLVNLQMRQTDDPGVKLIMAETQNRVRAMSLIHERLYRSESLAHINFGDYTRFLATQLFSFYGMDSRRVRLDLAMSEIMVDINTAVPLGLLMNELVSNALKHAFPDGRTGTIRISGGDDGGLITLVVQDNGIGIPNEIDWKNTETLGMRLITSLIEQVDGTITLDHKNGTAFTISIKRENAPGGT